MSYTRILAVAFTTAAAAYGQTMPATTPTYDYTLQGNDWNDPAWTCLSTSPTIVPIQSPADIVPTSPDLPSPEDRFLNIVAEYYNNFRVAQNLHSIRVTPEGTDWRGKIEYDTTYYLEHYDIRAPAEHLVDGKRAELEIQLIFRSNALNYTGLSFLYDGIAEGDFDVLEFARVLSEEAPTHLNSTVEGVYESSSSRYNMILDAVNMAQSAGAQLVQYNGSSTYPPCAENYHWFVFAKIMPLPISSITPIADLLKYAGTLGNYRDVPTSHQGGITFATWKKEDYALLSGAFGIRVLTVTILVVCISIFS